MVEERQIAERHTDCRRAAQVNRVPQCKLEHCISCSLASGSAKLAHFAAHAWQRTTPGARLRPAAAQGPRPQPGLPGSLAHSVQLRRSTRRRQVVAGERDAVAARCPALRDVRVPRAAHLLVHGLPPVSRVRAAFRRSELVGVASATPCGHAVAVALGAVADQSATWRGRGACWRATDTLPAARGSAARRRRVTRCGKGLCQAGAGLFTRQSGPGAALAGAPTTTGPRGARATAPAPWPR